MMTSFISLLLNTYSYCTKISSMHYDIMKILLLPALVITIAIIAIFQFFIKKGSACVFFRCAGKGGARALWIKAGDGWVGQKQDKGQCVALVVAYVARFSCLQ